MALKLEEKKAMVAELGAQLVQAQAVVVAQYSGLAVGDMTALRSNARKAGVYLRVLKNTLARRAVADTPFAGLSPHLSGPLAYGISADPVAVAKVLHEFAKSNERFVLKAGAMPNLVMSAKDVASLAQLPSREQLLAQLMATMQAPVAKFVRTLNEVPGKFVRTLAAVRDQKAKETGVAA